ncbi:unnamed protein product [Triticum turgidum subsp. durum]|uniref:Uncharacterized protein n=1 Tax=Triticum turgidum subsp. durum TaxID=4567 RepID=A0A9R1RRL0_TRITD|nr:unnamed protein product [Triticum turgidum subsp. durum]
MQDSIPSTGFDVSSAALLQVSSVDLPQFLRFRCRFLIARAARNIAGLFNGNQYSLVLSGIQSEVRHASDINDVANNVYQHNSATGPTVLQTWISGKN